MEELFPPLTTSENSGPPTKRTSPITQNNGGSTQIEEGTNIWEKVLVPHFDPQKILVPLLWPFKGVNGLFWHPTLQKSFTQHQKFGVKFPDTRHSKFSPTPNFHKTENSGPFKSTSNIAKYLYSTLDTDPPLSRALPLAHLKKNFDPLKKVWSLHKQTPFHLEKMIAPLTC